MFYYDIHLKKYEDEYDWDNALIYLEKLDQNTSPKLLTTIIGFSWYYLVEGPIISHRYSSDKSIYPLKIWKKYIDLTIEKNISNQYLDYIIGYTLSLHGIYLGDTYEQMGEVFINKAKSECDNINLMVLIDTFSELAKQKKYKPIYISNEILLSLFKGDSRLDRYFVDLYTKK